MRASFLVAALLISACSADIPEGVIACTVDDACPPAWFCHANSRCYSSSEAVADSGHDASEADSGGTGGGDTGDAALDAGFDAGTSDSGGTGGVGGSGVDGGYNCIVTGAERCDLVDNDCDTRVDEGLTCGGCSPACGAHADCTHSATCVCRDGYTGNGFTCTDIDECSANADDCDDNATCTNTPGSFSCECNQGYEGTGVNCADFDECSVDNGGCGDALLFSCTNNPGAAPTCVDLNACVPSGQEVCDGLDNDCDGTADNGNACPAGCTGRSGVGGTYALCTGLANWSAARSACAAAPLLMRLVRINDATENAFINTFATDVLGGSGTVWIGANDATTEGEWRWLQGTMIAGPQFWMGGTGGSAVGGLYANWASNQPDGGGSESCAQMLANGTWNDTACGASTMGFVCEK